MKITISKNDVIRLHDSLKKLNYKGTKFNYFLLKNIKILDSEVEIYKKLISPKEEQIRGFLIAKDQIIGEYVQKHENGDRVIDQYLEDGNVLYKIQEDKIEEFNSKMQDLQTEFKDQLESYHKDLESLEKEFEEKIDLDVYSIKFDDLPEEMSKEDLEKIFILIE